LLRAVSTDADKLEAAYDELSRAVSLFRNAPKLGYSSEIIVIGKIYAISPP
jgi:hypothetical protein